MAVKGSMKILEGFVPGFYEATTQGISYRGNSQELLLFTDIEILNPDEFSEKMHNLQETDWIGAWFGEEDLYLLLK